MRLRKYYVFCILHFDFSLHPTPYATASYSLHPSAFILSSTTSKVVFLVSVLYSKPKLVWSIRGDNATRNNYFKGIFN
jgi:hypothetical protein